ncbi:hypothetical protein BC940DRAFT_294938 [Gongronella butleri]|nr:hypothetical protein BC940DRAFT_294938 [Gongronella butleri]
MAVQSVQLRGQLVESIARKRGFIVALVVRQERQENFKPVRFRCLCGDFICSAHSNAGSAALPEQLRDQRRDIFDGTCILALPENFDQRRDFLGQLNRVDFFDKLRYLFYQINWIHFLGDRTQQPGKHIVAGQHVQHVIAGHLHITTRQIMNIMCHHAMKFHIGHPATRRVSPRGALHHFTGFVLQLGQGPNRLKQSTKNRQRQELDFHD